MNGVTLSVDGSEHGYWVVVGFGLLCCDMKGTLLMSFYGKISR